MNTNDTTTALTCPKCLQAGRTGTARIGNRRGSCSLCNAFAQKVRRETLKALKDTHEDGYLELKQEVEKRVYPDAVRKYKEVDHAES